MRVYETDQMITDTLASSLSHVKLFLVLLIILSPMFNLGEYDEEEAKEIRTFLIDAGIKVELKPSLVVMEEQTCFLHGRHSLLKDVAKDMDEYEGYLSVLKSVLVRSTTEAEFDELFMAELDPTMTEKRDKILALSQNPDSLSEVEKESLDFNSTGWLSFLVKFGKAQLFAQSVLSLNDIEIGEPVGDKLDDPLLDIPVNSRDYDPKPEQYKTTIEFHLEKTVGVYVDEFTTPLSSELDEEFSDLYPEEYQNLRVLGMLIEKLATSPTSRKMDFGEFIENCSMRLKDEDGDDIFIDGEEVAEELAKVLEKSDVVKIKGDKVKWKSER